MTGATPDSPGDEAQPAEPAVAQTSRVVRTAAKRLRTYAQQSAVIEHLGNRGARVVIVGTQFAAPGSKVETRKGTIAPEKQAPAASIAAPLSGTASFAN